MSKLLHDPDDSPSTKVNKLLKFFLTNVEPPGRSLVAVSFVGVCTMPEPGTASAYPTRIETWQQVRMGCSVPNGLV